MTITFYFGLLNKNDSERQSIYIRARHGKLDFKRTLHLPIQREWWNFKKNELLKKVEILDKESQELFNTAQYMINWYERDLYLKWATLAAQLKNGVSLSSTDWKNWCEKIINNINAPVDLISETPKLTELWKRYIELKEKTVEESESTVKGYRDKLNAYKQFEKYHISKSESEKLKLKYVKRTKQYLTDELDMDFYAELKAYFVHKKRLRLGRELTKVEKQKTLNYFGDFIKKIRAIGKYYAGEGFIINPKVFSKEFKVIYEKIDFDILTASELKSLWNLKDLTPDEENTIKIARILYFGCLRISDLVLNSKIRLNDIEIKDDGILYWTVTQKKSRAKDRTKVVPILDKKVQEMIKDSSIFPSVSDYLFNKKINQLVKRTGTDKEVSSHTFRRSILTNMYNANVPISELMRFSGHKREQTLLGYIKKKENRKTKVRIDEDGNVVYDKMQ